MENTRKWTGWILIVGILVITVIALGMNTLSGAESKQVDPTLQQYEGILVTLFPKASHWEKADDGQDGFLYRASQGGQTLGYAVSQTVQGYAGPVEVITAVTLDGTIAAIHVGGSDFRETENLGGKTRDAAFSDQFKGQSLPVTLGQEIDAVSGATVTSQAVVNAVNQVLPRLQPFADVNLSPVAETVPEKPSGMTANASAIGYGGPVLVRLSLDDQGKIAHLDIGGARFAETEGVGSRVRDESFIQSFIGLTPPLALNKEIDGISGATVSSQAVVDAVNDAAAFLMQKEEASDTN